MSYNSGRMDGKNIIKNSLIKFQSEKGDGETEALKRKIIAIVSSLSLVLNLIIIMLFCYRPLIVFVVFFALLSHSISFAVPIFGMPSYAECFQTHHNINCCVSFFATKMLFLLFLSLRRPLRNAILKWMEGFTAHGLHSTIRHPSTSMWERNFVNFELSMKVIFTHSDSLLAVVYLHEKSL